MPYSLADIKKMSPEKFESTTTTITQTMPIDSDSKEIIEKAVDKMMEGPKIKVPKPAKEKKVQIKDIKFDIIFRRIYRCIGLGFITILGIIFLYAVASLFF